MCNYITGILNSEQSVHFQSHARNLIGTEIEVNKVSTFSSQLRVMELETERELKILNKIERHVLGETITTFDEPYN